MLWMARARTLAPTWNLVGPFRLSDALVDWLAAGEPFAQLLAINRSAEKRLEHREQGLRFFESERTVSHKRYVDILIHFGRCGAGTLVRESDMNPVFAVQGQLAMLTAYRSSRLSLQTAHAQAS